MTGFGALKSWKSEAGDSAPLQASQSVRVNQTNSIDALEGCTHELCRAGQENR